MNVNELLDTIEDALEESANVPLSGGKRIVDVEQIRDYLDEVRAALPGELRQAQRLGTKVGERRSVAETHLDVLLHAEAALFGGTEQQRLGFDPTHRGGELPAQQFGEQQTAELLVVLGVGIPHLRIVQRGLDALGRHDLEDLRGEFLGHLERHGHQVRNVTAHQTATVVDVLRQQRVKLVAELRHALAQQRGVERHVDCLLYTSDAADD